MGEVHTGLLRGRDPMTAEQATSLVDLVAGEPVASAQRPRSYVRSPQRPVGVDCPPGGARKARGIGTVLQRAAITDGHVVQGVAYATLRAAGGTTRRPWSHYLAWPGVIEVIGRVSWSELAESFAAAERPAGVLDLGQIAGRASDVVQSAMPTGSQSGPRLRLPRTRLRFVAGGATGPPRLTSYGDELRLLQVDGDDKDLPLLVTFAEDVALHDWLLTSVMRIVERAAIGRMSRAETLHRLEPALDYLLHLWLPAGRGGELVEKLWDSLDRQAALTRQWALLRDRIRDQFAVGAVAALSAAMRR
ncbi:SCO2521 family protein [Actinoplanes sp. NPDC049596]|uniref:SCO2521 family protein n=1 Tax=unclassified Actinoplanes TaxID=2626549 RepID=UPI003417AACB